MVHDENKIKEEEKLSENSFIQSAHRLRNLVPINQDWFRKNYHHSHSFYKLSREENVPSAFHFKSMSIRYGRLFKNIFVYP